MELQFNLDIEGIRDINILGGNICITLKKRFQNLYRLPYNGQQIILDDSTLSVYHLPLIHLTPSAVTSPMYLFQALEALNLDLELCLFLHDTISNPDLRLFSGGSKGFYLFADVEVVHIDVVEGVDVVEEGGDDDDDDDDEEEEEEEGEEEEELRIPVEKLSRKQKREVKAGEMCAICLDEFEEREAKIIISMPCDHIFHASCISRWLEVRNSCPLCRRGIQCEDLIG